MIEPFESAMVREGVISYGISSYGYDFRVDRQYKIFRGEPSDLTDPKNLAPALFEDFEGDHCQIEPRSFVLAHPSEANATAVQ